MTDAEVGAAIERAFDCAACGLLQTSEDGSIQRVNRLFCQWTGYASAELLGRRFQELLTVGGRIFHQTHWVPLIRMQGSVSEVKLEVRTRDGAIVPMVVNAIARVDGGTTLHELAVFVARDRDRYEQELVRARRRLEDAVAELNQLHAEARDRAQFAEQMIGIVSHDLRNPLSTILMGAALLARGTLSAPQQRTLGQISRASERANRLISDLLDFTQARIGAGLAVSPVAADLHAAAGDVLDELRLAYDDRELCHVRDGDGACLVDVHRLGQLLGNLVSNAVKYGARDQAITISTSTDARTCEIAVHNHGAAIPSEVHARLFEPMTRGSMATTKERSVGLGLFIVREIARAHGGQATVRSAATEGTTFLVRFPKTLPIAP